MRKEIARIAASIAALLFASGSSGMDVHLEKINYSDLPEHLRPPIDGCILRMAGEIVPHDLSSVKAALSSSKCPRGGRIDVVIESNGGDVETAMKIGRLLRAKELSISTNTCVSACNLIAFGAVSRIISGPFGIHRPFAIDSSYDYKKSNAEYQRISEMLAAYLSEMNIDPSISQMMLNTSPENIRWLTYSELKRLNIAGMDPAYHDKQVSRMAKEYGISKSEMYSRLSAEKAICNRPEEIANEQRTDKSCSSRVFQTGH